MSEVTLIPLLQADQRERWQRGDRASVETYLEERPALQSDPDGLLDLIYHEMLLREESGETPRLPEYLERFPRFEAELRRRFDVHQVVESELLDMAYRQRRSRLPSTRPPSRRSGQARSPAMRWWPSWAGAAWVWSTRRGIYGSIVW
jgi:hypothetical protein